MFTEGGRRSAVLLRELAHQWETGAIDWREYRAARASLLAAQASDSFEHNTSRSMSSSVSAGENREWPAERESPSDTDEPRILSFEDFRRMRRADRFESREGGRRRAA
jgi:hypothetical protein